MKPYRTNLRDVPHVAGLKPKDGWINMQVNLIDQKTANSQAGFRLDSAAARRPA
jgi:hypothetical protein